MEAKQIRKTMTQLMRGQAIVLSLFLIISLLIGQLEQAEEVSNLSVQAGIAILGLLLTANNLYMADKKRFAIFKPISQNQREIGLIAFYFMLLHIVAHEVVLLKESNLTLYIVMQVAVMVCIYLMMWITSFKPVKKQVKKWKQLHQLVWLTPALFLAHTLIFAGELNVIAGVVFLATAASCLYGLVVTEKKSRNRQQLIYIVIGVVIGVVQLMVNASR